MSHPAGLKKVLESQNHIITSYFKSSAVKSYLALPPSVSISYRTGKNVALKTVRNKISNYRNYKENEDQTPYRTQGGSF